MRQPLMKHVLLALCVFTLLLVPGGGESAAQLAGGSGGGGSSAAGASADGETSLLTCFSLYLVLQMSCHNQHCSECSFLWFTWTRCDKDALAECLDEAGEAFKECLAGQGS